MAVISCNLVEIILLNDKKFKLDLECTAHLNVSAVNVVLMFVDEAFEIKLRYFSRTQEIVANYLLM